MVRAILAAFFAVGLLFPTVHVSRAADLITVSDESAKTNWPNDITFSMKAQAPTPIKSVRIEYSYGGLTRASGNPKFEPGRDITAQFELRTRGSQDVPPGALITYRYTIEDEAGNTIQTDPKEYRFLDTRFTWQPLTEGRLTLFTNQGTNSRAQALMQGATRTLAALKSQAGVELTSPLTIVAYATTADLDSAYPPRAASSFGTRAGVSVSGFSVVLVTTAGDAVGTVTHEVTHAVIEQTVGPSSSSGFPMWLNEGLATYFQPSQGSEWSQYLQQAIRVDRVLPLRFLKTYPGKEEEWLLVYAEGVSVVKYLLNTYGPEKMGDLLRAYRDGDTDDRTFQRIYGKNVADIENEWRKANNIKPSDSTTGPSAPTGPQPIATLPPLTIDQPGSSPTTAPVNPGGSRGSTTTPSTQGQSNRLQSALPLIAIGGGALVVVLLVGIGAFVIVRRNQF